MIKTPKKSFQKNIDLRKKINLFTREKTQNMCTSTSLVTNKTFWEKRWNLGFPKCHVFFKMWGGASQYFERSVFR